MFLDVISYVIFMIYGVIKLMLSNIQIFMLKLEEYSETNVKTQRIFRSKCLYSRISEVNVYSQRIFKRECLCSKNIHNYMFKLKENSDVYTQRIFMI